MFFLGLCCLARSDEGPKALFVGECIGRTSNAWVFHFGLDLDLWWTCLAMMNCVQNLYPEHGGWGFIHRGKGKKDHKLYLGRFSVPLTSSTLIGQTSGWRNWYPSAGTTQRITVRIRPSHICEWLIEFLATPVNNEQGGVR